MPASIIQHLHLGGASLSYRKKFRLFFTVVAVVLVLGCVKIGVHYFGLEFLELNTLLTSGIGGAIFIIGFLLSSILADYKEAERIPADIRTSIEAIDGDLESFAAVNKDFDLRSTSCVVRKRTTKLAAMPIPSSRPKIEVNFAISSKTGGIFL